MKLLNAAQRNYLKRQVEELKSQRMAELGKIVGWTVLGILLLPTIIIPYLSWVYVKKAVSKRKEIEEQIKIRQRDLR